MTQQTSTSPPPPNVSDAGKREGKFAASTSKDRTVKQEATQAVDDAKAGAQRTAAAIKSEAASMVDDVQTVAADAAQGMKVEGHDFLDRQKRRAADEVSHFEAAIRRASETLRAEDDDNLADYADRAAEKLSRVKSYLHRKKLGDVLCDVENAARQRPELVFGGLLVAGLAAARFLKASSRTRSGRRRSRERGALASKQNGAESATAYQSTSSAEPVYEIRQRSSVDKPAIGSHEL
ncbi:MAG: hypothetical protein KDA52_03515 [Planctomycetaceae bacterium]|nr:hypothetical protein [Planctomycetaceae bacterium]